MIFLNVLISFSQIFFIPGLIYSLIKGKFNFFLTLSISLFFNYVLIIILSFFKIYTKDILLIFITSEILIFFVFLKIKKFNLKVKININYIDFFFYLALLFIIYKLTQIYYPFFGSIFSEGDVIRSWNEWSYNLFGSTYSQELINYGSFESEFKKNQSRSYYGQLIPSLWSIFYILTENGDATLFPKFFNFTLSMLALIYLLINFISKKRIDLFFLIIFIFIFYYKEHAFYIYSGLVDGVIASLLFLSLLLIYKEKDEFSEENLLAGIILAIIISNIKISTLYYSLIFLPFYLIFNYYKILGNKLFKYLILLILLSQFWFIYQFIFYDINIFISNNLDYLKRISVNNFSDGYSLFLRLFNSNIVGISVILVLLISLVVKQIRYITLFLVFPYIIIWYNFSSYDLRNLLLIVPIICFILSKSVTHFFKRVKKPTRLENYKINYNFKKSMILKIFLTPIIIITIFININQNNLDENILKYILEKKINLKDKIANKIIINGINKDLKIYSDYIYIKYVLTHNQFSRAKLCSYFQKKDFSHCKKMPNKGSMLISYYNNNAFLENIKKNYDLDIIYSNKNFKIFEFK